MLYAAHYQANEALPSGLRLLIRAPEPNDDLAGAVQSQASPQSFFYRFLRPKHYLSDKELAPLRDCDFINQVARCGWRRPRASHVNKQAVFRIWPAQSERTILPKCALARICAKAVSASANE